MIRLLILILVALCTSCKTPDSIGEKDEHLAQIIAESGDFDRKNSLISIDLDAVTSLPAEELALFEITKNGLISVPCQVHYAGSRRLFWQLNGLTPSGKHRTYKLVRAARPVESTKTMTVKEAAGNYVIMSENVPLLQYQAATAYPPEGFPEIYKRSGFIHPLFSPSGQVLTNIQPVDHMHHYGLWNPWTKTSFRNEEVDFWNLAKGQGTIRHAGLTHTNNGDIFASLGALHNHIAWPETDKEALAMHEQVDIKVFNVAHDMYIADFNFVLNPREPVMLEEYRYGGFCLRGTADWTNQNSDFVTSEGLNHDQADGERARWCLVGGPAAGGKAGILMMGHPANFNHPEPLRVWPSDANNGRGDVFINFSPTRNTDWSLEPGNAYILRYRLVVFDGLMDITTAEMWWNDYESPVQIIVDN